MLQIGTHTNSLYENELYINTSSASATGIVTTEGFVVFKGSTINEKTSESLSDGVKKLRTQIMSDDKKVKNLTTIEDILFSSSSSAAGFVLGYSVSGPRAWKTKDGRYLREIQDNDNMK